MEENNFERYSQLIKLGDSLKMAEIRCLNSKDILMLIPSLWNNPERELIYRRILEIDFSNQEIKEIVKMLNKLNIIAAKSQSKAKGLIDRSIMRISDVMVGTQGRKYFANELNHPRKTRRKKAYRSLLRIGLGNKLTKILIDKYEEEKDQEALELIVRDKKSIHLIDVEFLLDNLENEYWRMRVIESLINETKSVEKISNICNNYPWEFIYAVGRTKEIKYSDQVKKVVAKHKGNLKILGISAWTFGKLQEKTELSKIKEIYLIERGNSE